MVHAAVVAAWVVLIPVLAVYYLLVVCFHIFLHYPIRETFHADTGVFKCGTSKAATVKYAADEISSTMKPTKIEIAESDVAFAHGAIGNVGISEDDISIEEGSIQKESTISPERCFVCGDTDRSMMSYYSGRDSIGIIHWNNQSVFDTEVRLYDDDGNELFDTDGSSTRHNSFGDSGGCK